jgi:hypothetical protein
MKARFPLIAALGVALSPLKASAQAWVNSPDISEGIGIRAGNLELHPSVGAEFGYDSNFYQASKNEGVVDVLKLRVTPSLTLSTLGDKRRGTTVPPKVLFSSSLFASYFELFPLDSANSEASKRRNVSIGADVSANVNPAGKVGFDVLAAYIRMIEAEGRTDDLAGQGFMGTGFNRDTLRGGGGATWRPGGGLFEWRLGYLATYNWFENDRYDPLANLQHDVQLRGRWRFLPRSALLFDSTYSMIRYTSKAAQQPDGDIVRTRIGFHGLVTYHLALMGMLGWASSFYETRNAQLSTRNFDSIVANAEARWFIQPRPDLDATSITSGLSSIGVGYARSFNNSYLGSFYQRDRGYLQFSMFLVGAVAAGLEFGISRVAFPQVTDMIPAFTQTRIDSRAFAEYRFTDTLGVNASFLYDQNISPRVNNEDLEFTRWQAYLGVRWFM